MADILSTTLVFSQGQPPTMEVAISISFSQRELAENFLYGINVAVVRSFPNQQIITRHKGRTSMEYFALPAPNQPLQLGYTSLTLKPDGRPQVDLLIQVQILSAPPSGQQCKALVTVVPEIAETMNLSPDAGFP